MKTKFELILDKNKKESIIKRASGLYQLYKNIYLTKAINSLSVSKFENFSFNYIVALALRLEGLNFNNANS